MKVDLKRRAARIGRTVSNWDWKQRVVALLIVAAVVYVLWSLAASIAGGVGTARQTRRDAQLNANVSAELNAASDNHNSADAYEADRREADGRYQESQREVSRARTRAAEARTADQEASRRHEKVSRNVTLDSVPVVTDDDVCADLRSVGVTADGCREK